MVYLKSLIVLGLMGLIWLGWHICGSGITFFKDCREADLPDSVTPTPFTSILLTVLGAVLILAGIFPLGYFIVGFLR